MSHMPFMTEMENRTNGNFMQITGLDALLVKDSDTVFHKIIQCSPIPQFAIGEDHRVISWKRALGGIKWNQGRGYRGHEPALAGVQRYRTLRLC